MDAKIIYLTLISLFAFVWGQVPNSLDDLSKQLDDNLANELQNQGFNITNFNASSVPLDKAEKVFREKCEKQGAGDVVDEIKNQREDIQKCVTDQVDFEKLQEELDEAKKTGSMDEVFGKYCKKWPEVYACIENTTSAVRRCLTENEEKEFNRTLQIAEELHKFMCFKDGDRLAMFVAEGGVECVTEKKDGIEQCLNATLGGKVPKPDELSVATLPIFAYNDENCKSFDDIHECVRDTLETCNDKTPANIVDAFFKFLKKQMPCEAAPALKSVALSEKGSGADKIVNSLIATIVLAVLVRFY